GSTLIYSTLLGGSNSGGANAVTVDSQGEAYITGFTTSSDYSTKNALYPKLIGNQNAFLTKVNAAGSALVYSTYLAATTGYGIAVDASGNPYVAGTNTNSQFPLMNAIQPAIENGSDTFLSVFSADATSLTFSTN